LFTKSKPSEEWHEQVAFTAGHYKPSDPLFPYPFLRRHTDYYLKRKGKLSQGEVDVKLAALIDANEKKKGKREVAIAACGHAMSPAAVRALINSEVQVANASFKGLDR
ncbi:hypothetical protein CC80DRAFT_382277, partial [Byssothecium circinans]